MVQKDYSAKAKAYVEMMKDVVRVTDDPSEQRYKYIRKDGTFFYLNYAKADDYMMGTYNHFLSEYEKQMKGNK